MRLESGQNCCEECVHQHDKHDIIIYNFVLEKTNKYLMLHNESSLQFNWSTEGSKKQFLAYTRQLDSVTNITSGDANHHHLTFINVLGVHSDHQLEAPLSASYHPQQHLADTLTSCKRGFLLFHYY